MTPIPVVVLTTPNQNLYNLTDMLDVLPPGERLPLKGKGEMLPVPDSQQPVFGSGPYFSRFLRRLRLMKGSSSSHLSPSWVPSVRPGEYIASRPREVTQVSPTNSLPPKTYIPYRRPATPDLSTLRPWTVTYTHFDLEYSRMIATPILQPVPIHKKKGTLSVRTVLNIVHELNISAVHPRGFSLPIPKHHKQIEVQFQLLVVGSEHVSWLSAHQHDMNTWPLAKKWLLVHHFSVYAWLGMRRGGISCGEQIVSNRQAASNIAGALKTKNLSTRGRECANTRGLPAPAGRESDKPAKTAYHYIWRNGGV